MPVLKSHEIKAFYDWFGKKQNSQGFYEDSALEDLTVHSRFGKARKVFEFGCGTGRFAEILLGGCLPTIATYVGCDLSSTMVKLARGRLAEYGGRAQVLLSGGFPHFPLPRRSVDRVVSTYVLDLLPERGIQEFLAEARRVLRPGGKLCLVSMTEGITWLSRIVSSAWNLLFGFSGFLVGGCRPIRLELLACPESWEIEYRKVVVAWGVPSEVLVARPKRR